MKRDDDMSISELNVTKESEEPVMTTRVIKGYKIIKCIGRGASGNAYLVKNKEGAYFVLKQIDLRFLDHKEEKQALNEVLILRALSSHRHIIGYIETFIYDNHLYIIMEYADGGNLSDFLTSRSKPLSNDQVIKWATQLTLALDYVHSKKVLHRDLKSQNIFITTRKNRLLLGDFGISKVLNATQEMAQTVIGTPSYLSPELYENQPYCSKSDVWALGCIFYEMCTGKLPFEGTNMAAIMMKVLTKDPEPLPPQYKLGQLIMSMLEKDPNKRPTLKKVLKYPLIRMKMKEMAAPFKKKRRMQSISERSYKEPVNINDYPPIKRLTAEHVILEKQLSPKSPMASDHHQSEDYNSPVRVKINIADIAEKPLEHPVVRVSLNDVIKSHSPTNLVNSTFDKPSPETPILPEYNPIENLTNIVHTSTPLKMPKTILSPSPIVKTQNHHIPQNKESPTDELILVVEEKKTPRKNLVEHYPSPSPLTGNYEDMSNFDDTLIQDDDQTSTPIKPYPSQVDDWMELNRDDDFFEMDKSMHQEVPRENRLHERRKQRKLKRLSQQNLENKEPNNVVPRLPLTRVYKASSTTSKKSRRSSKKDFSSPMSPRSVANDRKNFLKRRKQFFAAKKQEKIRSKVSREQQQKHHVQQLQKIRKNRGSISSFIKEKRTVGKEVHSPEFLLVTQFGEKSISNQENVK